MKAKIIFKVLPSDVIESKTTFSELSTKPTLHNNHSTFSVNTVHSVSARIPEVTISKNDHTLDFPISTSDIKNSATMISSNLSLLEKPNSQLSGSKTSKDSYSSANQNRILDVKIALCDQIKARLDQLILYTFIEKTRKLYDQEELTNHVYQRNNQEHMAIFYYKIDNATMRLNIEYFQNNIDKFTYDISPQCTVYALKYLINTKLLNTFPINEQSLVFSSNGTETPNNSNNTGNNKIKPDPNQKPTNINKDTPKAESSKELKDDKTIAEVYEQLVKPTNVAVNVSQSSTYSLLGNSSTAFNLLLIRKGVKRCSIGLDFSFSFMRNLKKIPFEINPPAYREVRDGMNIFNYCLSKDCKLFNHMFVKNFGYGKFDIVRELKNIYCPICYVKNAESRSIGFVNCEWSYRGVLANKHNSIINGDGITIDHKLYVMNETNLLYQIEKLEILIKEININYNQVTSKEFFKMGSILNSETSDCDPLKDCDVQFSAKRKDLFPDPSTRNKKMLIDGFGNITANTNNISGLHLDFSGITDDDYRYNRYRRETKENKKDSSIDIKIENNTRGNCCFMRKEVAKNNTPDDKSNCCIF